MIPVILSPENIILKGVLSEIPLPAGGRKKDGYIFRYRPRNHLKVPLLSLQGIIMETGEKTYIPDREKTAHLDLREYRRPAANKGYITFSWCYAVAGALCIIILLCKPYIAFVQTYHIMVEAMGGILLFLAAKCYFTYARESSMFLRWDCTSAEIIKVRETAAGRTYIDLRFTPETGREQITFTEEINAPLLDRLQELKLGELPVLYQPSRCYSNHAYYVDIRFNGRELDTTNLKTIKKQ